jgi:hypothetical protein
MRHMQQTEYLFHRLGIFSYMKLYNNLCARPMFEFQTVKTQPVRITVTVNVKGSYLTAAKFISEK